MKTTRRELLLGLGSTVICAGCGGGSSTSNQGDASTNLECSMSSDGGAREYCLLSALRVRVPAGAALRSGEAMLLNADDNTAVILARDDGGLYARSGICTHACCIVALCDDSSCGALTPTPLACASTDIVRPNPRDGVICPCHGSSFRLSDGSVVKGPARTPLPTYLAIVDGRDVIVDTGVIVHADVRA
jgi:Rieske Fe-S protein